jgi:hypothetical protein
MKKITYLFCITFIVLQSCSSGGSSDNSNNDSLLLRRWYFVSTTFQGTTYYPTVCNNNGHRDYVDFLSSNIANFYHVDSSTGNNCSDQYALETYHWVKNGNIINFTYFGNNSSTCVISELTATTLKYVETDAVTHGSSLNVYSSY